MGLFWHHFQHRGGLFILKDARLRRITRYRQPAAVEQAFARLSHYWDELLGHLRRSLQYTLDRLGPHGLPLIGRADWNDYLNLGEISSYLPGYKENASVFCHTNPWIMIAETQLGHGDLAHDYYLRINPSARESISEVHRCEPYVYAQTIAGRDAVTHGEAKNSWLSGTAAWNYVAITQWILGIRPGLEGLEIQPVIPRDWPGFKAVREWRGTRYEIEVERQGVAGAVEVWADGQRIAGNLLPLPPAGTARVQVRVILK